MSTGAVAPAPPPRPPTGAADLGSRRRDAEQRLMLAHDELARATAEVAALRGAHGPTDEPPRPVDLFDHELARTRPAPRRDPPPLTAADWPTCVEPNRLLAHVAGAVSERKLRLVTAAAARLAWDILPPEMREAVETAERLADGLATADELQWYRTRLAPYQHAGGPPTARRWCLPGPDRDAFYLVFAATYRADMVRRLHGGGAWMAGSAAHAGRIAPLVRDIVGKPFHSATIHPGWLTPDVRGLAAAAYHDRAFDRLPLLADALADAGCDDEAVLSHCRGSGPHARGCWVVDLVLGNE
jgi:hypothetical protein